MFSNDNNLEAMDNETQVLILNDIGMTLSGKTLQGRCLLRAGGNDNSFAEGFLRCLFSNGWRKTAKNLTAQMNELIGYISIV